MTVLQGFQIYLHVEAAFGSVLIAKLETVSCVTFFMPKASVCGAPGLCTCKYGHSRGLDATLK